MRLRGLALFFLSGCHLDRLGHNQDLLSGWLVVVHFFGMLFEMRDQFIVAVGAHSEAARRARDFLRHTETKLPLSFANLTFWGLAFLNLNRFEYAQLVAKSRTR